MDTLHAILIQLERLNTNLEALRLHNPIASPQTPEEQMREAMAKQQQTNREIEQLIDRLKGNSNGKI